MVHDQEKSLRGVGVGGSGGGDGGGGGWSRSAKKPKLPKAPPQRGLGVAQLEKILREKDQNMDENKVIKGVYSSLMGSPHNPHHPPTPIPPPPVALPPLTTPINNLSSMDFITRHLPVIDNSDHLIPPLSTLSGSGGGGGGAGGGSARILSGHENLSSMWSSHESNSDGECFKFSSGFDFPMHFPEKKSGIWPSPPMLPSKHCRYPPWVIDSGMNHKIEPPSNQRSYNYTSTWPEEEKTVGIKRRWTSSVDDDGQTDPPSSCGYGTTRGSELNKPTFSFRDLKKEVQPKLNPKKGDTDCGTLDANFLTLGLPATSSHPAETFSDEFSGFYSLPLQVRDRRAWLLSNSDLNWTKQSDHQNCDLSAFHDKQSPLSGHPLKHTNIFRESIDESIQSSGHGGSSNGKPFYRILTANSQVGCIETSTSSVERRCETGGGGGADLNLKLSLDIFNEPMVAFLKES
ncbi:unnamed protein product [Camellia sinensis]